MNAQVCAREGTVRPQITCARRRQERTQIGCENCKKMQQYNTHTYVAMLRSCPISRNRQAVDGGIESVPSARCGILHRCLLFLRVPRIPETYKIAAQAHLYCRSSILRRKRSAQLQRRRTQPPPGSAVTTSSLEPRGPKLMVLFVTFVTRL